MSFTIKQLEDLKEKGLIKDFEMPDCTVLRETKKSKYGNKKVLVDGILFDSKKEANRYFELKLLKAAGSIYNLFMQVPFELNEGGTHSMIYKADFTYQLSKDDSLVVEDAKGYRTKTYLKKKRLMKKILGIEIKEI